MNDSGYLLKRSGLSDAECALLDKLLNDPGTRRWLLEALLGDDIPLVAKNVIAKAFGAGERTIYRWFQEGKFKSTRLDDVIEAAMAFGREQTLRDLEKWAKEKRGIDTGVKETLKPKAKW